MDNIQNSIMELKKEVDNLKLHIHLKHFNSHIKYPTIHVFNAVQKFTEHSSNNSKNELKIQCHQHPPNSILEVFNDMLSETSLADLAKLYSYESSAFRKLIQKIDKIVEALTLSQAACSGMQEELEDAKYDFRKLRKNLEKILQQINRSKDIVHENYFNFTKIPVKEYLLKNVEMIKTKYSTWPYEYENGNAKVGKDLFALLQTKYNYGPLYIVGVSRNNWVIKDDMTHYGNLQEGRAYNVQHNGISVIVFQAPSLCDTYYDPHDNLIYNLTNKCADGDSLTGMYKSKCGDKFTCAYTPQCGIFGIGTLPNTEDIFISNGGVCRIFADRVRTIIMKPFTSNYTYKPIELWTPILWNTIWEKDASHKKPFSLPFYPVEYLKDEILFVEEILRLSEMEFTEKLFDTESLKNDLTANIDGQKYTNFKAGYNYIFYGKIICDNESPIGENAIVSLIEVDEFSPDDIISVSNVDNNGDFIVKVDSSYNDFPSSTLELKLKFENCCGYSDHFSGNLKNGTNNEYTFSDEGVKFSELL